VPKKTSSRRAAPKEVEPPREDETSYTPASDDPRFR
jgi:hypothetical protein